MVERTSRKIRSHENSEQSGSALGVGLLSLRIGSGRREPPGSDEKWRLISACFVGAIGGR